MKYYYNEKYGVIIYPDNWWDVGRLWITRALHPSFQRVWKRYGIGRPSLHAIERKLEVTEYPDLAGA